MEKLKARVNALAAHPKYGWVVQFAKFSLVGVSSTFISLSVYYLSLYALGLHYQLSNLLAFLISVTNAYYWNSRYVFGDGRAHTLGERAWAYGKTVVGYSGTYFLGVFLMWLWVEKVRLSEGVAPLLNLFITVPINYFVNKYWTFSQKRHGG